jgi:hypothetical protein
VMDGSWPGGSAVTSFSRGTERSMIRGLMNVSVARGPA